MKLLFDQNLSHKLVRAVAKQFSGSRHVRDVGLSEAEDHEVWAFASEHGFTIISKDSDFHQRSLLFGAPPRNRLMSSLASREARALMNWSQ